MTIGQSLERIANWVKEKPIKSMSVLGLAGLIAVTSLKDNVHFGSVDLYNPQENNYTWGIFPTTHIHGDSSKGNIYTVGIITGINKLENGIKHKGDVSGYGLIAAQIFGDSSAIEGDASAYGLIAAENWFENGCKITGDINSKAILTFNIDGPFLGNNSHLGLENYVVSKKR